MKIAVCNKNERQSIYLEVMPIQKMFSMDNPTRAKRTLPLVRGGRGGV